MTARLLRAECPVACREPAASEVPSSELAAIAWCPQGAARASAHPSAGAQQALRSARPAASAEPVTVLRPEAAEVRYALPAEASRASAAARPWEPAAVLRAAAGQDGAVEQPREVAAGAARLWAAAEVAWVGAAVRRPAALDVQRAEQPSVQQAEQPSAPPWVCHPDRTHSAPELPPAGRFARAMQVPRIALP